MSVQTNVSPAFRFSTRERTLPSSVVYWFLLDPVLNSVGISIEMGGDEIVRQGGELLYSGNGDIHETSLLTLSEQGVVNLSGAHLKSTV